METLHEYCITESLILDCKLNQQFLNFSDYETLNNSLLICKYKNIIKSISNKIYVKDVTVLLF